MRASPLSRLILLGLAVISLTVIFVTFYFSESPWESPSFENDSELLVTRKIRTEISLLDDIKAKGGFLYSEEGNISTTIPSIYTSQFGLQGLILNSLQEVLKIDELDFIAISRIVVSLLFAITITLILCTALSEFGWVTMVCFLLLVISSFWIVAFSKNLYWVAFTMFIPFSIGWYFYPRVIHARSRFSTYLIITGCLILLKSLNGYEYITNVILGASIGPLYYELGTDARINKVIKKIVLICLAGIAGFLVAYGLHLMQLIIFTQDYREAISILIDRAATRTLGTNPYTTACDYSNLVILTLKYLGSQSIFRSDIPLVWLFSSYAIGVTLLIPLRQKKPTSLFLILISSTIIAFAISVDMFIGKPGLGISQLLVITLGICGLLYGIVSLANYIFPRPDKLIRLALTTTWALLSSFSWVILAKNHMSCHLHINSIVFYIPFGITLFLFLGYWLDTLISNRSSLKFSRNYLR